MTIAAQQESRWLASQSRARRLRGILDFAVEEMIIPDGPYRGRRFRPEVQPFARLFLEEIDRHQWPFVFATGPVQSGKTFATNIIPTLYHLFETQETVIYGLPDMTMAADKWHEDILPAIEATRYRDALPRRGGGSRGGTVEAIRFANGTTLRFMSGGGNDAKRSAFTGRVLVLTEVDKMDTAGGSSRESDKVTQLIARTRAYGSRARIYGECTVSIKDGRIWQELKNGTDSRIVVKCPRCEHWTTPERDHLVGWKEAADKMSAREGSAFCCPDCGTVWTTEERIAINRRALLVHRGQEVTPAGDIVGPRPRTDTLGFRWNTFNNLFVTAGDVGAAEYNALRSVDEDNADREMCQFWWAVPAKSTQIDVARVTFDGIAKRTAATPRGLIPDGTAWLTCAVDLGLYLGHWAVIAWTTTGSGTCIDYGRFDVPGSDLAAEKAIQTALFQFRDFVDKGWMDRAGKLRRPDVILVDTGYQPHAVYPLIRKWGTPWWCSKGYGATQDRAGHAGRQYSQPQRKTSTVKFIGDQYHISALAADRVNLIEINADAWKSWIYDRLTTPAGQDGALLLYQGTANEHTSIAKHLTAERKTEEFVKGVGMVTKWVRDRRSNHWFDVFYMNGTAAHFCGVRVSVPQVQPSSQPAATPPASPLPRHQRFTTPDGRAFLITERE